MLDPLPPFPVTYSVETPDGRVIGYLADSHDAIELIAAQGSANLTATYAIYRDSQLYRLMSIADAQGASIR